MSNNLFQKYIYELLSNSKDIQKLLKKIQLTPLNSVTGLSTSFKSVLLSHIANKLNIPILFITPSINKALSYRDKIETLLPDDVKYLHQQETSPYQLVYSDSQALNNELETLRGFKNRDFNVLVSSHKALLNYYPSFDFYDKYSITLDLKKDYDPYRLAQKLIELGYTRATMVTDRGEFSLRGDILDIYPLTDEAVRIEFWGDRIDSIRYFNTETQRTIEQIKSIKIEPRFKTVLTKEKKEKLIYKIKDAYYKQSEMIKGDYKEALDVFYENLLSTIETDTYFEGVEFFSSYIEDEDSCVFNYLPPETLIVFDESSEINSKIKLQDANYWSEYNSLLSQGLALPLQRMNHIAPDMFNQKISAYKKLELDSFLEDENSLQNEIECSLLPSFGNDTLEIAGFLCGLRSKGVNILVLSEYPQRVSEILNEFECPCEVLTKNSDIKTLIGTKDVVIAKNSFSEGFNVNSLGFVLITDTEIFNRKTKRSTISKKLSTKENLDSIVSIKELQVGDYVVHLSHGIGKYTGLCQQEIDGEQRDYLTIEYSNSDKLHMPAEQINLLSRYRGSGTTAPKLSKMGGADWNRIKGKVKKSIEDIAQDLLNLYAKRSKGEGYSFDSDTPWQIEMEDAFPYTETPDQLQSIIDTKNDMESVKPMDRLICGDVGFGKTEIAIRAIFKAVLSGKQVALLVPTTILAQQHYLNLSERFKPYPVEMALLSRFKSQKEQKETVKKLITGECDFVIGTHRLLQKDIEFKDLGLLVIDEEHRFGVSHKEKMKQLRAEIDVLSLSATPIPRTLYMSLSGVRDMSIINTPPVNRAPIKTFVGKFNESFLKSAINYELEREGQVYILYNKVQSIYKFAHDIQELLPHAKIAIGHGQMKEKELENIMYGFSNNEFDILICTTIIESGVDIPNANTMIICDADKFGLAQLYQIRGRVGRSERQAFCYCFYSPDKVLTEDAQTRLKAIKDFTTLGSGYQIALRDLEIRGVGNLLGSQQHGHMISVGFDMYCSLLDETIKEFQGEKVNKKPPPIIDINVTAYIPDDWVGDSKQKMIEYKRLGDVKSIKELDLITEEWVDRFGKLPQQVIPLMKVVKLRLLATNIGINLLRETYENIRIYTDYRLNEWNIIRTKLPKELLRILKWTKAPQSTDLGESIILLDNSNLTNNEVLDILEDLFYYISELQKSLS